jgi:Arm domain-containing DNA-binding protein
VRLDARTVADAVLPTGKSDAIFFDDDLPGFGLRLRAGGNRSYVAQYRGPDGRTRRVTIGSVAKLTPTDARSGALGPRYAWA